MFSTSHLVRNPSLVVEGHKNTPLHLLLKFLKFMLICAYYDLRQKSNFRFSVWPFIEWSSPMGKGSSIKISSVYSDFIFKFDKFGF